MRKVVLQMMTTLNGRIDDPGAWLSDIPEDVYTEINRLYPAYDTVLTGHNTYKEMSEYWPGAETEEGGSENNKRMARQMNTYKKVLFTRRADKKALDWNNAEYAPASSDEEIVSYIRDLKAQSGGDILVAGGATLAQTFVRLGLVDEYRFFVYPVVSPGAAWFDKIVDKRGLDLISATPYPSGVVGMYYSPKKD